MSRIPYEDPDIPYEEAWLPYESATPFAPQPLETWVTTPDGVYICHLDRSAESPFRNFAISLIRNQPGAGSLEYHPVNELLRLHPTALDMGNLVWMKYRGKTRAWIIEDARAVLEEGSEWRVVSGRGTLQLLARRMVFPTDFADGANLDPATWTTQWRTFTNRAPGEMLWDLISDSNARFEVPIARGTVSDNPDHAWTQDFRFDNLLDDVISDVVAVGHGDVEMEGLTFNYFTYDLDATPTPLAGQGQDRRSEVVFEEGADLLSLTSDKTDRNIVSYIVGEGVGEGVFAKLAKAQDFQARYRVEGFLAAKDATNVPLLQSFTDAALTEHTSRETISFDVTEGRYLAFSDYDLGDTVTAKGPSLGVNTAQRIDAIYLKEEDDRVRIALDLNGLRDDELLRLYGEVSKTRIQLGVRDRQPQGQLNTVNANESVVFDETTANGFLFDLLEEVYVTVRVKVAVAFRPYVATATSASASGALTSDSGGGGTSGSQSTPSGGGSTSGGGGGHVHAWAKNSGSGGGSGNVNYLSGGGQGITINSDASAQLLTDSTSNHDHTTPDHTHSNHDHTTPNHQHTTPAHDHDLVYSLHNEPYPASHDVSCAIYLWDGANWDLMTTVSGLTDDVEEFYVEQTVDGPGLWRFEFQSAPSQPNAGRLAAYVSVAGIGAIKSS